MTGRPSPIDQIIGHDQEGNPITVADSITNSLRMGAYFEQACATAGVTKETGYAWLRTAGKLKLRARGGSLATARPSAQEKRCLAFSDAVAEAESSYEVDALSTLGLLARGGYAVVKTVVKRGPPAPGSDAAGPVLESTTTTERLAPSAQVIQWRLARRFPARYGQRVEITGAEGGPVLLSMEERADALAETLTAFLQGAAAARPKRARSRKGAPDGEDSTSST